ncbi:MAG: hypothetical protein AAGI07_07320 [Bacteroidota bacterium]
MKKKIKIVSIIGALYLSVLPILFFAHTFEHQLNNIDHLHHNNNVALIGDDVNCDLCDLFFNQDILDEKLSDYNVSNSGYISHFRNHDGFQALSLLFLSLRAPPQKFPCLFEQIFIEC